MDQAFCPGARLVRQPAPELFECPGCGAEVEIWTDEVRRNCPACGRTVHRETAPGCLDWCKYAEECVGEETWRRHRSNRAVGIRSRLLEKLRELAPGAPEAIARAESILAFAEKLLEPGGADPHVVIPAAVLLGLRSCAISVPDGLMKFLGGMGFSREDLGRIGEAAQAYAPQASGDPNRDVLNDSLDLALGAGAGALRTVAARALADQVRGGRGKDQADFD